MKTILVLTDFSKKAELAKDYALNIAKKVNTDLLLLNVVSVSDTHQALGKFTWRLEELFTLEDKSKKQLREQANILEQKVKAYPTADFQPTINYISKPGNPGQLGEDIKNILERKEIWMIVMGTKGDEYISNFIPGTNAYSVICRATCPVLFIPEQAKIKDISRIALVSDLKDRAPSPLPLMKALKEVFNAEVLLTDVTEENSKSSKVGEFVEVSLNAVDSNRGYSKVLFIETENNNIEENLQRFTLSNRIDLLTIVHCKEDVFRRIFHSGTTKLLTNSNQMALLVFPCKLIQSEYLRTRFQKHRLIPDHE
ncbi:MAG: universal stress protein [Sphingobacteriaceae bacterium]